MRFDSDDYRQPIPVAAEEPQQTESPSRLADNEKRLIRATHTTVETNLLNLEVDRYSIKSIHGSAEVDTGAIEIIGESIILGRGVEGRAYFYSITFNQTGAQIEKLPIEIDLNWESYSSAFQREHPGKELEWPPRITDLLYLEDRRTLAVSFVFWNPEEECQALRVMEIPYPHTESSQWAGEWGVLYTTKPCFPLRYQNHESGGRLALTDSGSLLLTVGDFGNRRSIGPEKLPRTMSALSPMGKIVEIDLASGSDRYISVGHRNPQGLAIDSRGQIWSTEHGPRGGDELNMIRRGANYGWPLETLGTDYASFDARLAEGRAGRHDRYPEPVFSWVPSIGVSNLIQSRGFHERWEGDLLVASLNGNAIHRLRLHEGRVLYDESVRLGFRIRDIVQSEDGSIFVWNDSGGLVRLRPGSPEWAPDMNALPTKTRRLLTGCAECHSFGRDGNKISLRELVGRKAAVASAEELYSQALKTSGIVWTRGALDRFLADPDTVVPDTTMAYAGIKDPKLRQQIVDFLADLE